MKKYRSCFLVPNFGASFGRAYSYDDENLIAFEGEVSYAHYDAWGNVLSEGIAKDAVELRTVRYRFQGRERSAATGLTNFRMRWYDAVTGRWLSKDPIGLSGGLSLYAFCGGDPVNQADWIGLCGEEDEEGSFWEDYFELATEWMVDTSSIVPTLTIGPWPKHLSPATGGRGPGLGSSNPLTSVPRAFGGDSIGLGPFLRSAPFRGGVATVAVSIVGIGCWNVGVAIGVLVGAMF